MGNRTDLSLSIPLANGYSYRHVQLQPTILEVILSIGLIGIRRLQGDETYSCGV